jgi:hypothetical protein
MNSLTKKEIMDAASAAGDEMEKKRMASRPSGAKADGNDILFGLMLNLITSVAFVDGVKFTHKKLGIALPEGIEEKSENTEPTPPVAA